MPQDEVEHIQTMAVCRGPHRILDFVRLLPQNRCQFTAVEKLRRSHADTVAASTDTAPVGRTPPRAQCLVAEGTGQRFRTRRAVLGLEGRLYLPPAFP
ncbi:hypothetical protein ACL02R_01310 [Streptomyces sp. MS19]|uniref:hypothetical protein n=1 Tax=Streptomyces sp. MS19 TaxID=3385972 RepID=UPI0039A248D0